MRTLLSADQMEPPSRRCEDSAPSGAAHHTVNPSAGAPSRRVLFRGLNSHTPVHITQQRLPHWVQEGVSYFVTFRLADSVPVHLQQQWQHEREAWLRFHPEPWSVEVEADYRRLFPERLDQWLDAGMGECHLRRAEMRDAVDRHMRHLDGQRYDVDAFVLMPNHVHLLITPRTGQELFALLKGIKGTSARTVNKLLGRTGASFWMEDSYNRIVRDSEELIAFRKYIEANPVKASLRPEEFTLAMQNILYVE